MNEELMREAGFGGGFKSYTNLLVDNGSDIAGTDATGEFVEISFNDQTKEKIKTSHGKEIEGVLLLSRAVLTYRDKTRTKKKVWESEEFNPILNRKKDGEKALIPIYKLDFNGQRQKTQEGQFIVDYAFYEDLQAGKKQNLQGMDYTYTIVLYVLTFDDETGQKDIIKLRFKGASRGNFFKYQQLLWRQYRTQAAKVFTKFSTYLEKEYNKYAIAFSPVIGEDSQPRPYHDPVEIENEIGGLLEDARNKRTVMLPPSQNNVLRIGAGDSPLQSVPEPTQPQPEPTQNEDDDEIKVEDIPF